VARTGGEGVAAEGSKHAVNNKKQSGMMVTGSQRSSSVPVLGERVRYYGRAKLFENDLLCKWQQSGWVVPHCLELAAGFPFRARRPRSSQISAARHGEHLLGARIAVSTRVSTDGSTRYLAMDVRLLHGPLR
jgi:uncharacterized protein YbbK (DUF523 family)